MKSMTSLLIKATSVAALAALIVLSGCSEDDCTCPLLVDDQPDPPSELAEITCAEEQLTIWPYTGRSFDGTAVDPINLVFVGQADPIQVRAALLGLDGDRTAVGYPDVYPFNLPWRDCIGGDVQTAYAADGEGWLGSVVQLQLGDYEILRVHLRLFRTDCAFGEQGGWTLGGAHFEVMIPGTADHQVLSWEIAEQVVVADLLRSGLLDEAAPFQSTGQISAAPSFREIPNQVYNPLPVDLKLLIGGPLEEQSAPVPIATDGEATILNLTSAAEPIGGAIWSTLAIEYDQFVPKPFCSQGPYDWLHVTGPISFSLTVNLDASQCYSYSSEYWGDIEATPVDMSTGTPQVVGEPFSVLANGAQGGALTPSSAWVHAEDRRLTQQSEGSESQITLLDLTAGGAKIFEETVECLLSEAR